MAVNFCTAFGYAKLTGRIPSRLARLPTVAPGAVPKVPNQPATPDTKAERVEVERGKGQPKPGSKPDVPGEKDLRSAAPGKTPAPAESDFSMTEKLALQAVINVILLIVVPLILRMT